MMRFLGGSAPRPLPRPGPFGPPGPPRRPPPPWPPPPAPSAALRRPPPLVLLWAAFRASARPPYGRSSPLIRRRRKETRWRFAVPRGGRRTSRFGRVGPRRVRRLAAAAVCDGARSSNGYSSGRRTFARLETAAGFPVPPKYGCGRSVIHPYCTEDEDVPKRHLVPGDVHGAQTTHRQNLPRAEATPKQATRFPRIGDVTPLTVPPLVAYG